MDHILTLIVNLYIRTLNNYLQFDTERAFGDSISQHELNGCKFLQLLNGLRIDSSTIQCFIFSTQVIPGHPVTLESLYSIGVGVLAAGTKEQGQMCSLSKICPDFDKIYC